MMGYLTAMATDAVKLQMNNKLTLSYKGTISSNRI